LKKNSFIIVLLFTLASCRTYYDKVLDFHKDLNRNDYKAAEKDLLNTRFLKLKRNEILRYLELGKVFHLQHLYDSSNYYFNKADLLMEEKTRVADVSTSVLVNEAVTRYHGEDFERVLVNYYKALNYLYLNLNEDALVEAKRINIRLNELADKQLIDGRRYKADAFAHTLQGFVYERLNDYNNAFISYRNACELYTKDSSNTYLGSQLPLQLKIDLINVANKAGFFAERDEYCTKFALPFASVKDTSKMRLLFIWENGLAPVKQQEDVMLFLVKGVGGDLMFRNKTGDINIPFPLPEKENNKDKGINDLKIVRIAYPTYMNVPDYYTHLSIQSNGVSFSPDMAENVTYIANATLKERFLKEMTLTLSRIALKKIAEAELKKNKDTELAGAILGIVGALMEKADTRNWQSLPSYISYTRIPVNKADTLLNLELTTSNGQLVKDTLRIKPKSALEIINYSTLQHHAPTLLNR
jgi:uncharacterized protein